MDAPQITIRPEFIAAVKEERPAPRRVRKAKGRKNTPRAEDAYADLIRAGVVQVIRRKGLPPLIRWL